MTRSWAWPINSPREKTSATRPSWPRGTRLDNCQIFFREKYSQFFQLHSLPTRHSQWTDQQDSSNKRYEKILIFILNQNFQVLFPFSRMTEWENKTKANLNNPGVQEEDPSLTCFFQWHYKNYGKLFSPNHHPFKSSHPRPQRTQETKRFVPLSVL